MKRLRKTGHRKGLHSKIKAFERARKISSNVKLRSPPSTETTSVSVGATLEESTNTTSETAVAETEMNGLLRLIN